MDQRLVLGQLAVGDKSNEIVAVPKLLELLSLKGRIVTADAMSCQRKIAQQVIDQGADYVLALKGNQEMLHDDVCRFLDDPETALATASETDKGHGRIETRTAALTTDIAWLIGIGGSLTAPPLSHTTVHTGPYTAVRWIERTPVPAGGVTAGVWRRASARTLRSLHHRAVGLHLSVLASRPATTGVLPHGAIEMRVSTPHFHPFGPSADRSA